MSRHKRPKPITCQILSVAPLPGFVHLAQRHYEKAPPAMKRISKTEVEVPVPMDFVRMALDDPKLADGLTEVALVYVMETPRG